MNDPNEKQKTSQLDKWLWGQIHRLEEQGFSAQMIVEILGERARDVMASSGYALEDEKGMNTSGQA